MTAHSRSSIILESNWETVVADAFQPEEREKRTEVQSEAELERLFIERLQAQGYELFEPKSEAELEANIKECLQKLNNIEFADDEWRQIWREKLANPADGIREKTRRLCEEERFSFRRNDGTLVNITIFDKDSLSRNKLQVIHQYREERGTHAVRGDVTILLNGFPIVHVELKRRGVAIKDAFNQIARYQKEAFWAGAGLFNWVMLFVISNGTDTRYYSNTTRLEHVMMHAEEGTGRMRTKLSASFEFTSCWADGNNKHINDLMDFAGTFLARNKLLAILARFCVFTADDRLLVLRPYQIRAAECIVNRLLLAYAHGWRGTVRAGGYVWHATGSGKTLTSFVVAVIVANLPFIDKVVFVVDRRDLDYQTTREYNRYREGAVDSNASAAILKRQLEDEDSRIIVTTIQKLGVFIRDYPKHEVYGKDVVFIFDECHRSQFGELRAAIDKAFKFRCVFGFTGTPIFPANAGGPLRMTTEQAFGDRLHSYTMIDAIADRNVLPWHVEFVNTLKPSPEMKDARVAAIDDEAALADSRRISFVVKYMLDHFDQKTLRNRTWRIDGQRRHGFNAMMAASSISMAKLYWTELTKQLEESGRKLDAAIIYSFAPNGETLDDLDADENFDAEGLQGDDRTFLEGAIEAYNRRFNTNFGISGEKFRRYYEDISRRMRNRELDLLVVVNMFLTGFDAPAMNTLWVDKPLRWHGLLQAFSRTNRTLNALKQCGNVVCFRDLKEPMDDALRLFGEGSAHSAVLIRSFDDYYNGYVETDRNGKTKERRGWKEMAEELLEKYPLDRRIEGEKDLRDFLKLFGDMLRLRALLSTWDEFKDKEILTEAQMQDYQSRWLDLKPAAKAGAAGRDRINDDLVYEAELACQFDVGIDYILMLIERSQKEQEKRREILANVRRMLNASLELRSKRELILAFIDSLCAMPDGSAADWREFVARRREEDLQKLIEQERLQPERTRSFLDRAFRAGRMQDYGMEIQEILPPMSFFSDGGSSGRREAAIAAVREFFDRYNGLELNLTEPLYAV